MMKKFPLFLFTLNILIPKYKKTAFKTGARFLLFSCLLMMYSCCRDEKFVTHKIANISLSLPESFVVKKEPAEDSQVFSINIGNKHIGYVYYGDYKPFEEDNYMVVSEPEIFEKLKSNIELNTYLSDNSDRDYRNGIYNVNYYYYDTINLHRAQIMLPKKMDKGSIGVHFDSVDVHKNKMAIIINDLSEENKELFLKIFKTIKINSVQY
ncbi:hypothetical protein [Chryseobacterium sp. MA9]|uniref:hypothetical protein n=1 Tax=Chryseobacterium sp. MA9 TaxID=2966625 RepID=UPI002104BDCE|nr:hypothetical protein [Chryseobacterium sp. MA9]UTX48292.1 hypothetical protein KIK00_20720 [Chryseobacterium sp. MA9]